MKEGAFVIIAAEGYYHHGALYEDPDAPVDEDVRPRSSPVATSKRATTSMRCGSAQRIRLRSSPR
jgi:hypothetical protein